MQPGSIVGTSIFRELEGGEQVEIVAYDIEQGFINMLATDEFKEKVREALKKTGRFGSGACFPVVFFRGSLQFKVYASVESARSKEQMPPPFTVVIEAQAGELRPDSIEIAEATVDVQRVTGMDPATAVDRARIETGIVPLVPVRTAEGAIVNGPGKHALRTEDYAARVAKAKETVARKKLERELAAMTPEDRAAYLAQASKEGEARDMEQATETGANLK